MSRGLLGDEILSELAKELPDLAEMAETVLSLPLGFIPVHFPPESHVPVAAVCLHDAKCTVEEARYAFHEVLAHRKWYLEKREEPNEDAAVFFGRFYTDDTALRLYSVSEHLAKAIVYMLEITKQDLEPYQKKNRISLQVVVGHYLINKHPTHPVTKAVLRLVNSAEWRKTVNYRNAWVHNQPPTVKGTGIVYQRRSRWQVSDSGALLTFGGGDEPRYSIDDLVGFVRPSLFLFVEVLTEVAKFYAGLVRERAAVPM